MYLYIFDNNNNIFLRFLDFFRGPVVDNIRLQGLEHVYMFTAHKGMIYLRSYRLVIILFLWDFLNGYRSTTLWNFTHSELYQMVSTQLPILDVGLTLKSREVAPQELNWRKWVRH